MNTEISSVVCRSLTDLIAAHAACWTKWRTGIWCRGHNKASWELQPSTFREFGPDPLPEVNAFQSFRSEATALLSMPPDPDDFVSWLATMQHYGLPTRLLDWSLSLAVAIYFSCDDESMWTQDGAVWLLHPGLLNKQFSGYQSVLPADHVNVLTLAANAASCEPHTDKVAAFIPFRRSGRMSDQDAAFTIHGGPELLNTPLRASEYLQKLVIPASAKESLASDLSSLGLTRSMWFRDVGEVAAEIRKSIKRSIAANGWKRR